MATWEPEGIDYDKIGDEDYKWDDDVIKDLELRFNKSLGGFHLARQNLMELTVLGLMRIVMIRQ